MIEDYIKKNKPKGIIHVGASIGQEIPFYDSLKIPILYFEPLKRPFQQLCENVEKLPLFKCEQLAVGNFDGEIDFYESSKGGVSSSPLAPTKHYDYFPERTFEKIKCKQITLDTYFKEHEMIYDTLVLDVQGYEHFVLRGANDVLRSINVVISEVWFEKMYDNSALKTDIDDTLKNYGFVETISEIEPTLNLFSNVIYNKIKEKYEN